MADPRERGHEPADGVVRAGGPARRRGDHDEGPLPVARRVVVYHAPDCGLCAQALEVVGRLHDELGFQLELVDIDGQDELERRYRVVLPAVEVDGELAFTYFVDGDELRALLLA